jgi:membrane protease YdiL (CAAX protease family)
METEAIVAANSVGPKESSKRIRALEFGLVFLIVFSQLLTVSIYTVATGSSLGAATHGKAFTICGILSELGALALLCYVLFRQGRSLASLGFSFSWKDIPKSMLVIVLAYLALIVWWLAIVLVYASFGRTPNRTPQNVEFMSGMLSVGGIVFLLLNPFFEELLVRAYVIGEVQYFTGSSFLALMASVLIQSGYHLYQGVVPAVLSTSIFTVFSLYFLKTKRIVPVILAHMFFDLLALVFYH